MELANLSVLLTRRADANAALANQLRERGAMVFESPLIDVEYRPIASIAQYIHRMGTYEAVVVTSGNAFRAVTNWGTAGIGQVPRRCYVVGQTSARRGYELGWHPVVPDGVTTGEELARWLTSHLHEPSEADYPVIVPRVMWLRGNRPEPKTFGIFQALGNAVDHVVCYDTITRPLQSHAWGQLMMSSRTAVVVVYSPSAVDALSSSPAFAESEQVDRLKYVAIGPTTAHALTDRGLNHVYVAAEPTGRAVLQMLQQIAHVEEA